MSRPAVNRPAAPGRDARAATRAGFASVTAAYWAFMLTDGALRMLVLLHFHALGFSAVQLAWLFVLYELAGIAANLAAGWIGTRFGLTSTLVSGLLLQVVALLALAELDPSWSVAASLAFVALVQGASGVAKDLTKTGAKSAVKRLAPSDAPDGALFRVVALLTGSKNAIKGIGFLLGGTLLAALGFRDALLVLAAGLTAVFVAVTLFAPGGLGRANPKSRARELFSTSRAVNRLAAARVFLFGARDAWFVVGIPVYFHSVLSDGTPAGDERAFALVGTFMAAWIIGYGAVQGAAPVLLGASGRTVADALGQARRWAGALAALIAALALAATVAGATGPDATGAGWLAPSLVAGLLAFGVVFALNSSLHSYLIIALAGDDRTAMDVGVYYSANALGRLTGTLLSGVGYQLGGVAGCLGAATAMALASRACAGRLVDASPAAVPVAPAPAVAARPGGAGA